MRINSTFDGSTEDLGGNGEESKLRPLWTLGEKIDDDKAVHEWCLAVHEHETKRIAKYRQNGQRNVNLYRGRHQNEDVAGAKQSAETSNAGLALQVSKVAKLAVNYLYDGVQQRLSRVARNKAGVLVEPNNAEYSDKVSARFVKFWSDYQIRVNKLDPKYVNVVTAAYMWGESYILPCWDPNKGDTTKDWLEESAAAKTEGRAPRLPLLDKDNNQIKDDAGQDVFIEKAVKAGDIGFQVRTPGNTLVETCGDFNKASYFILEDWVPIDEVKARYKVGDQDLMDGAAQDSSGAEETGVKWRHPADPQRIRVCTLHHRKTEFFDGGREVVFTKGCVLKNEPLHPDFTTWPLIRITDIDVPGEQRGISFFTHSKPINAFLNDLLSMTRENTVMMARPRWLVPTGSKIKRDALTNAPTVIEHTPGHAPTMIGPPPLSQEIGVIRRDVKDDLMRMLRMSDLQQGRVPPNIRSAMAMQMLDENDEERQSGDLTKYSDLIVESIEAAIKIAACYYAKDDPRLINIMGRDQRYILKQFDPKHLTKDYTVRISRSNGLPKSKAARTEVLIELKKAFPTLVRDEQVADALEWSDTDRFYDQAAVASRSAEAENEDLLNGEDIGEPEIYENHVVHWTVHVRELQNRGFKTAVPAELQYKMIEHVAATEYLMLEAARKNPALSTELATLPGFPLFFELGISDRIMLDRARGGTPLTLMEMLQLEEAGILPENINNGITPPPGGMPNPHQSQNQAADPNVAQDVAAAEGDPAQQQPPPGNGAEQPPS